MTPDAPATTPFLDLFVPGLPAPEGSLRLRGQRLVYDNADKLDVWRGAIWPLARNAMDGRPPVEVPVRAEFLFWLPRRDHKMRFLSQYSETDGIAEGLYWAARYERDDLDKLVRAVCDGLTEGRVWKDDAFVVELSARKLYADPPRWPPGCYIQLSLA